MRTYRTFTLFLLLLCTPQVLQGDNLLVNGDFEADTFTAWPGYAGNGGNPDQITGWTGTGNDGINPVFEPQNPEAVTGWTRNEDSEGRIGINPITDERAPFGDNGENDGGFLFMQGTVSAYQEVAGLTVGSDYVLTVDYNSRNCCGDIPGVFLEIGGELSDVFPDPEDFFDETVDPVLEGEWWFTEIPFEATAESMRIEFFSEAAEGGDATFLLDNIEVMSASGGNNLIENGDFEADLDAFVNFPGYLGGAGRPPAPFRDNGDNDTQIALMQNAASIEQVVEGLTVGEEYTISLDFNSRNCCGDVPVPQLLIDDEPLEDFPFEDDDVVLPVGEDNEWYMYETTFTADNDSVVFKIQTMSDNEGDSTFIVDNVFFGIPGEDVVGDCDGDGDLTGTDLACVEDLAQRDAVLGAIGSFPGDLDGMNGVNFDDFLELAANFDMPGTYAQGNVDLMGNINFDDFLELAANFGKGGGVGAAAVPEPSGAAMLGACLLSITGLLRRRR